MEFSNEVSKGSESCSVIDSLKMEIKDLKKDNLCMRKSFDEVRNKCDNLMESNRHIQLLLEELIKSNKYKNKNQVNSNVDETNHPENDISIDTKDEIYKCDICKKTFVDEMQLTEHYEEIHKVLEWSILDTSVKNQDGRYCEANDTFSVDMKDEHYTFSVDMKNERYKCDICKETFVDEMQLTEHYREIHKVFKCNICPIQVGTKERLETHMICHLEEKPFECDFCKRRYWTAYKLITHVNTFCKRQPICTKCGKYFVNTRYLLTHYRTTHERNRDTEFVDPQEVRCELCLKYCFNWTLPIHMKWHENEKKRQLAKNELDKQLGNSSSKIICEYCSKEYYNLSTFQIHMGNHKKKLTRMAGHYSLPGEYFTEYYLNYLKKVNGTLKSNTCIKNLENDVVYTEGSTDKNKRSKNHIYGNAKDEISVTEEKSEHICHSHEVVMPENEIAKERFEFENKQYNTTGSENLVSLGNETYISKKHNDPCFEDKNRADNDKKYDVKNKCDPGVMCGDMLQYINQLNKPESSSYFVVKDMFWEIDKEMVTEIYPFLIAPNDAEMEEA